MFFVLGLGIASSFSESLRDDKYFGVSSEFLVKVFTQAVLLNEPNIADIFWITDLFMLDIMQCGKTTKIWQSSTLSSCSNNNVFIIYSLI